MITNLVRLIFVAMILPVSAQAVIKLHDNEIVITDHNQIKILQVKTTNNQILTKCYNVLITLTDKSGIIQTNANVSVEPETPCLLAVNKINPGRYISTDGTLICKVVNMKLATSLVQSIVSCPTQNVELSVVTGPITNHPYESMLTKAGIPDRSDVTSQVWGVITYGIFYLTPNYYNYASNTPISIKTDGTKLVVSVYSSYQPSTFMGSILLIKQ